MLNLKRVLTVVFAISLPIAIIGGFLLWFFSPGVHIVGRFAHLDIQKDCYYVDMDSGVILGKSVLTLNCDTNPLTKRLSGFTRLPEYPVEGDVSKCSFTKRDGYLVFCYNGVSFKPGDDGNIKSFIDHGYDLCIKDAEHIFAVTIDDESVLVVCADSEREAREMGKNYYRVYWKMEPDWEKSNAA